MKTPEQYIESKFWRVVFLVIGGMAFFLLSVIGMNQEKLLISDGKQYPHDAIIALDRPK